MKDKLKIDVDVSTDEVAATGTTGDAELAKFRERINNIKRDKIKAKAGKKASGEDKVKDKVDVIVISSKPDTINNDKTIEEKVDKSVGAIVKQNEKIDNEVKDITEDESFSKEEAKARSVELNLEKDISDKKEEDSKILNNKDVSKQVIIKKTGKSKSKCVGIIRRKDNSSLTYEEKLKRLDSLEKKILLELDTKLKREIDELNDIIAENNKIVKEMEKDGVVSDFDIEKRLGKLEELLKKVNELIEQVQILQNNYKFEDILNLTDYQDQNIVNDIIEFRDLLDTSKHSEELTDKYKMLDSFIRLYREVYIEEETLKHNVGIVSSKKEETQIRDEQYLKFKGDIDVVSQVERECRIIIDKQNEYLKVLDRRISEITSDKVIEYKLRGVNDFLSSTLLYIGVMLSMPFKDKALAAGAKAMATGMLISNFRNMGFVQVELTKYKAEDFSRELYFHLNQVSLATGVIDVTLDDIKKLRLEFDSEFKDKVPGYSEVEFKLKEVELAVLACRKQLEMTTERINISIRENDKKLVRVKELNQKAF